MSEYLSKYEKQFFLDSTLTPPDTVCEVDQSSPFIAVAEQTNAISVSSQVLGEQTYQWAVHSGEYRLVFST